MDKDLGGRVLQPPRLLHNALVTGKPDDLGLGRKVGQCVEGDARAVVVEIDSRGLGLACFDAQPIGNRLQIVGYLGGRGILSPPKLLHERHPFTRPGGERRLGARDLRVQLPLQILQLGDVLFERQPAPCGLVDGTQARLGTVQDGIQWGLVDRLRLRLPTGRERAAQAPPLGFLRWASRIRARASTPYSTIASEKERRRGIEFS